MTQDFLNRSRATLRPWGYGLVLLYGVVIVSIGLLCAASVAWPAMLCLAMVLGGASLAVSLADGGSLADASLKAIVTLFVIQSSYIAGGFLVGFLGRRGFVGEKRST